MVEVWNTALYQQSLLMSELADIGKVLVGIQVPLGKRDDLENFLKDLQYPFVDETENLVYKSFMTQTTNNCNQYAKYQTSDTTWLPLNYLLFKYPRASIKRFWYCGRPILAVSKWATFNVSDIRYYFSLQAICSLLITKVQAHLDSLDSSYRFYSDVNSRYEYNIIFP